MGKIEKRFILISIALISLLCIGAVSAADDIAADDVAAADSEDIGTIDADITENDDVSLEVSDVAEDNPPTEVSLDDSLGISDEVSDDIAADESTEALGEDTPKTFTQLKDEISNPVDGVVTLSGTYKYDETADAALGNTGVVIKSNITINGPATLDGSALSRIFQLQGEITLDGLTFINANSTYGGAIATFGTSPITITNCVFKANTATYGLWYAGGAIYWSAKAGGTISGCLFESNLANNDEGAGHGGAISLVGPGVTIANSTFKSNFAATGATAIMLVSDNTNIINCSFDSNNGETMANVGAIYIYGNNTSIEKCNFTSNEGYNGGAIYYYNDKEGGFTSIKYCNFIGNKAYESGGAIDAYGVGLNIDNCLFDSNMAVSDDEIPSGQGGALMLEMLGGYEDPIFGCHTITNSIFINNQAGFAGSAIRDDAGYVVVKDCIILGPKTSQGKEIVSDNRGDDFEYNWWGHTVDNASDSSGMIADSFPDNWYVLNVTAEEAENYYNIIATLNNLYTKSTEEISEYGDCGISCVFNVAATAGTCAETVEIQEGIGTIKYRLYEPESGTISVDYNGVTKSIENLPGLVKQPEDVNLIIKVDDIKVGQVAKVEGQLTDVDGVGIVGIALTVVVNEVETIVNTVEEGKFSLDVPNLAVGQYSASVTLNASEDFKEASNSTTFNVKGDEDVTPATKKISTVITAAHTKIFTYNKAIDSKAKLYFIVTLKDANGKVLANKAFKYIVNGKTYNYKTNAKGQKKIYILSKAKKTISAKISFAGDSQYNAVSKAVKIKINPQKVKIVAKKKTFKAKKKVKKYTVTLKNSKGKAIKGKKLVLIIKKKKYTAKTNKKGKATFKIKNLNKKGTYKAKVKFAGDKTYKKITKKAKIKIK